MSKNQKFCLSSNCNSSSANTPQKLFIKVPNDPDRRNAWIMLSNRNPSEVANKKNLFLCEKHFDLEKDMENYMEYKIMGSVTIAKMKPDCLPYQFNYKKTNTVQPVIEDADEEVDYLMSDMPSYETTLQDNIKTERESPECSLQAAKIKDERISFEITIDENWVVPPAESEKDSSNIINSQQSSAIKKERLSPKNWGLKPLSSYKLDAIFKNDIVKPIKVDKGTQTAHLIGKEHKVVQTSNLIHYRSKEVQSTPKMRDSMTSPVKFTKTITIRMPGAKAKSKLTRSKNKSITYINISKRKQCFMVRKSSDDDDDDD